MRLSDVIEQLQGIQKKLDSDPVVCVRILAGDKELGFYPSTKLRMIDMILGNGAE